MGCSMNFLTAGTTPHQGTASEEVVELLAQLWKTFKNSL